MSVETCQKPPDGLKQKGGFPKWMLFEKNLFSYVKAASGKRKDTIRLWLKTRKGIIPYYFRKEDITLCPHSNEVGIPEWLCINLKLT